MSEPELRSVEMLQSVAKDTPAVEIIMLTHESIKVRVQGESHRWYCLDSKLQSEEDIIHHEGSEWSIAVTAGRWRNDVIEENDYSVKLCLHSKNQNLPIGDRIVSLVLALFNDIKTALQIPMLAQFIVCHRHMLRDIVIFQDTMIVSQDMIDDDWPCEDEMEQDEYDEMEWHSAMEDFEIPTSDEVIHDTEQVEMEQLAAEETRERDEQELINFWELMADKLLDK